jgi:CHASE1-domain containing sensor protein
MFQKIFSNKAWISYAILVIGIAFSFAAAIYEKNDLEAISKHEFNSACNEIETKISARLAKHAQLLRSGSLLFSTSDSVTKKEWKKFTESAKFKKNLAGVQGIGFSQIIKKEQLQQHLHNFRKQGFPDYTVRPSGIRDIYTSIIFHEPIADGNLQAVGYDMYTEPIRRNAMEQARDKDKTALSDKIILVQETDKDFQPGTIMFAPVYRNGMPITTIQERRAAIIGWVYCGYHMFDSMLGILGSWDLKDKNRIHLQVYENNSISQNSLLFDSQRLDSIGHNNISNESLIIPIVFKGKT